MINISIDLDLESSNITEPGQPRNVAVRLEVEEDTTQETLLELLGKASVAAGLMFRPDEMPDAFNWKPGT